jgi:hypothetical protein
MDFFGIAFCAGVTACTSGVDGVVLSRGCNSGCCLGTLALISERRLITNTQQREIQHTIDVESPIKAARVV